MKKTIAMVLVAAACLSLLTGCRRTVPIPETTVPLATVKPTLPPETTRPETLPTYDTEPSADATIEDGNGLTPRQRSMKAFR